MNGWVERESNPKKNQSAISIAPSWAPGELPFRVPVGQLGLAEESNRPKGDLSAESSGQRAGSWNPALPWRLKSVYDENGFYEATSRSTTSIQKIPQIRPTRRIQWPAD